MGTWDTAIFSDDTACDVRDEYLDLVGDGLSGPEATDSILRNWQNEPDPSEMGVVWLALAATQWKCGRLEGRVKREALRIIEDGSDLERCEGDAKLIRKRRAVLEKLRLRLLLPQPLAKKLPKRFQNSCEWKVGEIIAYRLLSGKWAFFRVIDFHTDRGGISPVMEILDFVAASIPKEFDWDSIGVKSDSLAKNEGLKRALIVGEVSEKKIPKDRIVPLGIGSRPSKKSNLMQTLVVWRFLDRYLREDFQLE